VNEELQPESSKSSEDAANRWRDQTALEDKGALKPCEACGGEFRPVGTRTFLQSIDADGSLRSGIGAEAITAICINCGLLRFHFAALLHDDWGDDDAAG